MRELSHVVENIKPSGIRRFFEIANQVEGVISLGVGEPDFDTPYHIRDEAVFTLTQGKTYYTANAGLMELREAISTFTKTKYDVSYNPKDEILVTVGGSEAIDLALRAIINPGDEVLCLDPSYVSYTPCIEMAGAVAVPLALEAKHNFVLQPEQLEAAITDKSKVLILNYPNNPTGAVISKAQLEALIPIIIEHDLYVISDEIYAELNYSDEPTVSIAALPFMKERCIYINGFSKAFAMTGWRLGYVCGAKEIINLMTKIHQFTALAAPTISQFAGIEALENGDTDVLMMRQSYNQRRRFILARFEEMGIPCFEPLGAFYAFPNISQFGMTSEEFAMKFLDEEKVAVVPGTAFGAAGEGFLRISYAYSIEELRAAFTKFADFVSRLRNEA